VNPAYANACGAGGGAGGGAMYIASSVSIVLNGAVVADGGGGGGGPDSCNLGYGGGGSGGAIFLAAPLVSGGGALYARGGGGPGSCNSREGDGAPGRIRVEASTNSLGGPASPAVIKGTPVDVVLPTNAPTVRVTKVDGQTVPLNPTGSFDIPDVTVNDTTMTIEIEAHNVPLSASVTVYVTSENGPDQVVTAAALSGGADVSNTTATVTLPRGFSRGYARATWK
jgi:hypothetical protein